MAPALVYNGRLVDNIRHGRSRQGRTTGIDGGVRGSGQSNSGCGQHDPVNCCITGFAFAEALEESDHDLHLLKRSLVNRQSANTVGLTHCFAPTYRCVDLH